MTAKNRPALGVQAADAGAVVLLTDVDGTIADPYGRVSDLNVRAAQALADFGIPLHLVTGRSRTSTANITAQLPCAEPTVLLNGAVVADTRTGATHAERCLPPEVGDRVVTSVAESDRVAAVAYTREAAFVVRRGPGLTELFSRDGVDPAEVRSVQELAHDAVLKLLLITRPEAVSDISEVVSKVEPDVSLVRSEPGYLEVLASGVDKGAGCAALLDLCGYQERTIVAMGNGLNDVPMFEVSSYALVPEGSSPAVLREGPECLDAPVHSSLARVCDLLQIPFQ